VPERWVLNASPLIALARVGQERLFRVLADEVVIPRTVVTEIEAGPSDDSARLAIASGQFEVVDVVPTPEILAWDLGAGETDVLSYAAAEPEWTVILDDASARKCARSLNLRLKGTLAVIILAEQHGAITSAVDVLRALVETGFRLDDRVIREALARTVGEEWK
jgi:predicted nucleic acid-binding protein